MPVREVAEAFWTWLSRVDSLVGVLGWLFGFYQQRRNSRLQSQCKAATLARISSTLAFVVGELNSPHAAGSSQMVALQTIIDELVPELVRQVRKHAPNSARRLLNRLLLRYDAVSSTWNRGGPALEEALKALTETLADVGDALR